MYERNAIILERYFNQIFGYNMKNNIKTNFYDYCELVGCLEKYKNISEEEEIIIQEYDEIANKIREKQKTQENLSQKNEKLQNEISNIFQNIDDDTDGVNNKIEKIFDNIQIINNQIKNNAEDFIEIVADFKEKSDIRRNCGITRRIVEGQYNKKLNQTLDDYKDIDISYVKKAKEFLKAETEDLEDELKNIIIKNGENEKILFNKKVIEKAIILSVDIQKRETEILTSIYEKINRLFVEIKNNNIKVEKHKKIIQDSKTKLEFLYALKEYLIQFLDNERLTSVNGKEEHDKLMQEACENLEKDLMQINNLYTLILKEIQKKITKKSYTELYNLEYLGNLEEMAEEFDKKIKELNLPVAIINPNYWRIDGMKKIYSVFNKSVTEFYERDLSEYFPQEEVEAPIQDVVEDVSEQKIEEVEENVSVNKIPQEEEKSEIDKKIDMILGFNQDEQDNIEDDDWEDVDIDYDVQEDNDWEDDEEWLDNDNLNYKKNDEEDSLQFEDDDLDDIEYDDEIWDDENIKDDNKISSYEEESNWENEFVNVKKRKKGFLGKNTK